jgi:glycosyltransferase involved in cell wall biosynthesis
MIVALVPAFDEENRISDVIRQAYRYVQKVLVCDDGSADSTYSLSVEAGAEVFRHRRNLGYGAALRTLFLKASEIHADAFVTANTMQGSFQLWLNRSLKEKPTW